MHQQILNWMGEYDVVLPEAAFQALCRLVDSQKPPTPLSKETRTQIAAVLLQAGTFTQQKQVLHGEDDFEFTALAAVDSALINIAENVIRLRENFSPRLVADDLEVIAARLEKGKQKVAYEMSWRAAVEDACVVCEGGAVLSRDPVKTLSSLLTYHLLIENDPLVSQLARDAHRFRALASLSSSEVQQLLKDFAAYKRQYLEDFLDRRLELCKETTGADVVDRSAFESWFSSMFPISLTTNPEGEYVHFQVYACERTWFAAYARGLQHALDAFISGKLPELRQQINNVRQHVEG